MVNSMIAGKSIQRLANACEVRNKSMIKSSKSKKSSEFLSCGRLLLGSNSSGQRSLRLYTMSGVF